VQLGGVRHAHSEAGKIAHVREGCDVDGHRVVEATRLAWKEAYGEYMDDDEPYESAVDLETSVRSSPISSSPASSTSGRPAGHQSFGWLALASSRAANATCS
jgi:hypothetical protein